MPQKPNTFLRLLIPAVVIAAGIGVGLAVLTNTANQGQQRQTPPSSQSPTQAPTQSPTQPPTEPSTEPATADKTEPDNTQPADADATAAQDQAATSAARPAPIPTDLPEGLRVETLADASTNFAAIGALADPYELQLRFSPVGAGIDTIELADYFTEPKGTEHVALVRERTFGAGRLTPMAMLGLTIGGQYVPLTGYTPAGEPLPIWRELAPGDFEAFITDAEGTRILRVRRTFTIDENSFELGLDQRIDNLTDAPIPVSVIQTGPADLIQESFYGGDKRRLRFGYLLDETRDPTQQFVQPDSDLKPRNKLLGKKEKSTKLYAAAAPVWPTPAHANRNHTLSWLALTNRYFAVAVHPKVDPNAPTNNLALTAAERVDRVVADVIAGDGLMLRMTGPVQVVPASGSIDSALSIYAGPLSRRVINDQPQAAAVNLDGLVVYNFGGMCAVCTFAWLADGLKSILLIAHDYITFDWALAIILLVIIVRTILHPVTRWSQIRVQRFAKQMQEVGPKQKKLQEKFKDDPKRLQQETAKLWKEEGISPAGMLGCLPMFLQTPVWIALYAVLYFSSEMRHQPAFFGVFQKITNGSWTFLADLAQPDRFLAIANPIDLGLMRIDGLNILPLLLGVVFYAHQKYLTPPTATTMTPEQEQQQKLIKVMMVVLFPLFMYGAPSGLALYFITNSTVGIFEMRHIRKSIDAKGLLDVKPERKKNAKPGFLARLYEAAQKQQQLREQQQLGPGRDQRKAMQKAAKQRGPGNLPAPRGKKRK